MARLGSADNEYNWLADFLSGHSHWVKFYGDYSGLLETTASIIQGSALGPASYYVTAAELHVATPGDDIMLKYDDDSHTNFLVPACNVE